MLIGEQGGAITPLESNCRSVSHTYIIYTQNVYLISKKKESHTIDILKLTLNILWGGGTRRLIGENK